MLRAFENEFFIFLLIFESRRLNCFLEKRDKVLKPLKSKFNHSKVFRKWFWSYLELKNKCYGCLKMIFFGFFANFSVNKLKPFSGKLSQNFKNFRSKVSYSKHFRRWFWSYAVVKRECSERLEMAFFSCLESFWVTKLKPISGKARKSIKNCLNQNVFIGSILENDFEATLR